MNVVTTAKDPGHSRNPARKVLLVGRSAAVCYILQSIFSILALVTAHFVGKETSLIGLFIYLWLLGGFRILTARRWGSSLLCFCAAIAGCWPVCLRFTASYSTAARASANRNHHATATLQPPPCPEGMGQRCLLPPRPLLIRIRPPTMLLQCDVTDCLAACNGLRFRDRLIDMTDSGWAGRGRPDTCTCNSAHIVHNINWINKSVTNINMISVRAAIGRTINIDIKRPIVACRDGRPIELSKVSTRAQLTLSHTRTTATH